jgi:hypothetical protein
MRPRNKLTSEQLRALKSVAEFGNGGTTALAVKVLYGIDELTLVSLRRLGLLECEDVQVRLLPFWSYSYGVAKISLTHVAEELLLAYS